MPMPKPEIEELSSEKLKAIEKLARQADQPAGKVVSKPEKKAKPVMKKEWEKDYENIQKLDKRGEIVDTYSFKRNEYIKKAMSFIKEANGTPFSQIIMLCLFTKKTLPELLEDAKKFKKEQDY